MEESPEEARTSLALVVLQTRFSILCTQSLCVKMRAEREAGNAQAGSQVQASGLTLVQQEAITAVYTSADNMRAPHSHMACSHSE